MQYVEVGISPDPYTELWPRDRGASFGCPREIQINFIHKRQAISLTLEQNIHLQPDRIPVHIGDDEGIHLWNLGPNVIMSCWYILLIINFKKFYILKSSQLAISNNFISKCCNTNYILSLQNHRHPACYYQDPFADTSFAFEYKDARLFVSGSFLSRNGNGIYALESLDASRDDRPDNDVIVPHPQNLPDNYFIVYRRNHGLFSYSFDISSISSQNVRKKDRIWQRKAWIVQINCRKRKLASNYFFIFNYFLFNSFS